MTFSITFDNLEQITENSKQVIVDNLNSAQDVNDALNCFVAAIGHELGRLATQSEKRDHRLAAAACEALWGELYQAEDESEAVKNFAQLIVSFREESEAWANLGWLFAMAKFIHEFAIYHASQSAENGTTSALEVVAHHKANLTALVDIISLVF